MGRQKKVITSVEFIYCVCGCGFTTSKYYIYHGKPRTDRPKKFINHHDSKGKILSEETKKKISKAHTGKKLSEEHKMKCIPYILKDQTGEKNHMFGKHHTEETKRKLSESLKGKQHSNLKDDVSYGGLHDWIRRYLPKPKDGLCQMCHQVPLREVANITGILNREFKNWAWFCAKCHKAFDNIAIRSWIKRKKKNNI